MAAVATAAAVAAAAVGDVASLEGADKGANFVVVVLDDEEEQEEIVKGVRSSHRPTRSCREGSSPLLSRSSFWCSVLRNAQNFRSP